MQEGEGASGTCDVSMTHSIYHSEEQSDEESRPSMKWRQSQAALRFFAALRMTREAESDELGRVWGVRSDGCREDILSLPRALSKGRVQGQCYSRSSGHSNGQYSLRSRWMSS